ncbi:MAG TPA: hypothetical protein VJT73_10300 [Polyangiaceae bacterium]|nr:hypothetical protein [Polyangiaceae bacterium]
MAGYPPHPITGVLHGSTITLDAPVPPLDGHRVRVTVEADEDGIDLPPADNVALLREWAAYGPQGPLEDDDDFPTDE